MLFNTLAADEKNPVLNRDNLTIPIQMQLFQKENIFSQFPSEFFKSSFNFKHFEKKGDPRGFSILEFTDSKNKI